MIIPVRCFTCNHVLADKWRWFEKECEKLVNDHEHDQGGSSTKRSDQKDTKSKRATSTATDPPAKNMEIANRAELLDKLGLKRLCCRRHMLGHVDMMELI